MDHGIVLVPSDGQSNKRKKWGRLVGVLEARRQWTVYKSAAVTAHVAPRIMIERCRVVTPWRDAAAAFNDLPLSLSLCLHVRYTHQHTRQHATLWCGRLCRRPNAQTPHELTQCPDPRFILPLYYDLIFPRRFIRGDVADGLCLGSETYQAFFFATTRARNVSSRGRSTHYLRSLSSDFWTNASQVTVVLAGDPNRNS